VLNSRAHAYFDLHEYDKAIGDYDRAIKLEPRDAVAHVGRAQAFAAKGEWDRSIADFDKAIALDSLYAYAFEGRGWTRAHKGEWDRAIADLDEAIRLDPKELHSRYDRAVLFFVAGRPTATSEAQGALAVTGWTTDISPFLAILAHFAARRGGQEELAKTTLTEAAARTKATEWPFAIIKYLRGELGAEALLAEASDNDKMTEARCYLALDLLAKGNSDEARTHLTWVKEHGDPTFSEYLIARWELARMAGK
jgi:lipoprotein NlpI